MAYLISYFHCNLSGFEECTNHDERRDHKSGFEGCDELEIGMEKRNYA